MSFLRQIPWVPIVVVMGTVALLAAGGGLFIRARGETNPVTLASQRKGVTVVEAQASSFRPRHTYVGIVQPWVAAKVGPQLVSAYVDSVLVRPGSIVQRGQVIATLDCRSTSTADSAIALRARAVAATQAAEAAQAQRVHSLLSGNYVSPDEAEMKQAEAASKQAEFLSLKAQHTGTSLEVADCVMRAPFSGDVSDRYIDPGAFIGPGVAVARIVDRHIVRVVVDVPEEDFDAVAPGTPLKIRVLATGMTLTAQVSRRAPAANPKTRTIRIEADIADPNRVIPVGTTAEITVEVGQPTLTSEIPLIAANVTGTKATTYVLDGGVVHRRTYDVLGERGGDLFLDTALPAGAWVVTEGREILHNGDDVVAKKLPPEENSQDGGNAPEASDSPNTAAAWHPGDAKPPPAQDARAQRAHPGDAR